MHSIIFTVVSFLSNVSSLLISLLTEKSHLSYSGHFILGWFHIAIRGVANNDGQSFIMISFAPGNAIIAWMLPCSMSALINNKLWRWVRERIQTKSWLSASVPVYSVFSEDSDEGRMSHLGADMTAEDITVLKNFSVSFPHYSSYIYVKLEDQLEVIIYHTGKRGKRGQHKWLARIL